MNYQIELIGVKKSDLDDLKIIIDERLIKLSKKLNGDIVCGKFDDMPALPNLIYNGDSTCVFNSRFCGAAHLPPKMINHFEDMLDDNPVLLHSKILKATACSINLVITINPRAAGDKSGTTTAHWYEKEYNSVIAEIPGLVPIGLYVCRFILFYALFLFCDFELLLMIEI